jgi:hypothetical protein
VTSASTVDSFRDRETVGIIGDPNVTSERATQIFFNWFSIEPGRTRALR